MPDDGVNIQTEFAVQIATLPFEVLRRVEALWPTHRYWGGVRLTCEVPYGGREGRENLLPVANHTEPC